MTKEECIALLERYAKYDGMEIPNLAGCKEAMKMAAVLLSQPSLPSNLDEAARMYSERTRFHWPNQVKPAYDAFKAGAKWMAGQYEKYLVEPEGAWMDRNGECFTHTLDADDPIPLENIVGAFDIYIRKKQ